jgi:methyl-accepting chemotaxis protein
VSIAAAVDQQSVAGQDLARSIDLAARNTEDVSTNIGQLRETSLATGAAASQVLTSSTELEQQAGDAQEPGAGLPEPRPRRLTARFRGGGKNGAELTLRPVLLYGNR